MKTLIIVRHTKSGRKDDPTIDDHDRPLNKRGKLDAPKLGTLIRDEGIVPDLILSSTAKRAKKTAEALIETAKYKGELKLTRDLYDADPPACLQVLNRQAGKHNCIMLVGHNPGLEEVLTGEQERLPTSAVAEIEVDIEKWRDIDMQSEGTLINIWRASDAV
jgi:phosphohistidine phosphatase